MSSAVVRLECVFNNAAGRTLASLIRSRELPDGDDELSSVSLPFI